MALEKIPQFNRIIDFILLSDKNEKLYEFKCPRHGRKPTIEFTGTYYGNNTLNEFNITIKNLYLSLPAEKYLKIKLYAGYADNNIEMEGTVLSMYQEAPGPEGRTVIQCQGGGTFAQWLDATVNLYYDQGTRLEDILDTIKTKLGAFDLNMAAKARALSTPAPFEHNGTARDAISKLNNLFADQNLYIFLRNETLCAVCYNTSDYIGSHKLEYISAPPQPSAGGEDGTYYVTVTAPWLPQLNVGDRLEVPQKTYMRYMQTVNASGKATQHIQVTKVSIHFGTTGGVNSMTVQGFGVKG